MLDAFTKWFNGLMEWLNQAALLMQKDEYLTAIALTIVIVIIKMCVNKKVCALDFKKGAIELPCEIITLSLGFLTMYVGSSGSLTLVWKCLFIIIFLAIVVAITSFLYDDSIVSELKMKHVFLILFSYMFAVLSFVISISSAMNGKVV